MPELPFSELRTQLAELIELPAIAGSERAVSAWICEQLESGGREPMIDSLGNVVLAAAAAASGSVPRILVTAHMDQVGYMVSRVEADHARCLPVGEPAPIAEAGLAVRIAGEAHPVLMGRLEAGPTEDGAVLRSPELDRVRVGDSVVFAGPLTCVDDRTVSAPALDNRIGCLIALRAALQLRSSEVAFAWTVREETEQAGVIRVALDHRPASLIALDVTAATAHAEGFESTLECGGGPVITLLDEGMSADRRLVLAFDAAATAVGLRWQPEVVSAGLSEAGRVHQALGIPSLALLVAVQHVHSAAETADLADVQDTILLLLAALER